MYHCHMLEHKDQGLMGIVDVVADDRERLPLP
jgi:FtsP/CotA-like multicopper oxidase with cupredoxin domain